MHPVLHAAAALDRAWNGPTPPEHMDDPDFDEGERTRILRPRVAIYGALIAGLVVLLTSLVSNRPNADVTLLRNLGRPFLVLEDGLVENTMRLKLTNRTEALRSYTISAVTAQGLALTARANRAEVTLKPGETATEPLHVIAPAGAFLHGRIDATLTITDDLGWQTARTWRLLGPTGPGTPNGGER